MDHRDIEEQAYWMVLAVAETLAYETLGRKALRRAALEDAMLSGVKKAIRKIEIENDGGNNA